MGGFCERSQIANSLKSIKNVFINLYKTNHSELFTVFIAALSNFMKSELSGCFPEVILEMFRRSCQFPAAASGGQKYLIQILDCNRANCPQWSKTAFKRKIEQITHLQQINFPLNQVNHNNIPILERLKCCLFPLMKRDNIRG